MKLRAATVIAEDQRVRGRRWTAIADRRIILVLARLAIYYVAVGPLVESTSSHHGRGVSSTSSSSTVDSSTARQLNKLDLKDRFRVLLGFYKKDTIFS